MLFEIGPDHLGAEFGPFFISRGTFSQGGKSVTGSTDGKQWFARCQVISQGSQLSRRKSLTADTGHQHVGTLKRFRQTDQIVFRRVAHDDGHFIAPLFVPYLFGQIRQCFRRVISRFCYGDDHMHRTLFPRLTTGKKNTETGHQSHGAHWKLFAQSFFLPRFHVKPR